MLIDHIPGRRRVRALILVPKQVADRGYLTPGDLRGEHLEVGRDVTTGLGDDFQPALDGALHGPIGDESIEGDMRGEVLNPCDRIAKDRKGERGCFGARQNTRNASASIRWRSIG